MAPVFKGVIAKFAAILAGFTLVFGLLNGPLLGQSAKIEIAILNQEAFFVRSLFGIRVKAELDKKTADLAIENRAIEAELQDEELALTKKRPTLSSDEFRMLADAFDAKVERIRTTRSQKESDLESWSLVERQRFFGAALPILQSLMQEIGAAVVLDSRTTILSSENLDVTKLAISRIDAAFGDGSEPQQ